MVDVIRDYDAGKGHTPATCYFVDMEFSDGSGILARARRSNASWKTSRVNKACEQAASILKDRCAVLRSYIQRAHTPSTPSLKPTQGTTLQQSEDAIK